jgi:hypothetical protein
VRRSACRVAGQLCSTCSSCGDQPRRTFLSARPRAHGLLRTRLMLRRCLCTSRRSRTLLGPFRQEPVASLIHSANARRAAARAGLRCSLIGLCSWNEAPCANLTWNSIIPSSSSGAPISNPGEPAEPFSSHNRRSCASLPSQQARAASQPYTHNDFHHQLIERRLALCSDLSTRFSATLKVASARR